MSTDQPLTIKDLYGDPLHLADRGDGMMLLTINQDVRGTPSFARVALTTNDAREVATYLTAWANAQSTRDQEPEKDTGPEEAPAPAEPLETTARRRCMALDTFHSTASSGSGLPEKERATLLRWLAGETATLGDDR